MMSMMRDCTSTVSSYFMRSQKRTYATDAAKNAIVTAVHNKSCMANLLGRFREAARRTSEGYSLPVSTWDTSSLSDRIHFYKFTMPGRVEFCKVNHHVRWPSAASFTTAIRTRTKNVTAPIDNIASATFITSPTNFSPTTRRTHWTTSRVRTGSRIHKEFVK
jgi:hypothetical protein